MFLYGAAILLVVSVILVNCDEAKETKSPERVQTPAMAHGNSKQNSLNTGELAKLIHKVNEDDAYDSLERSKYVHVNKNIGHLHNDQKGIDLDYIGMRNTNKKTPVKKIMKLLQKNYDANTAIDANPDEDYRVHYIQNPEVLQRYKEAMKKRHRTTSSSSSDSDSSDYDLRLEKLLRRNAVFRLGRSSMDDERKPALRNDETKPRKNSAEHDKIIHFEPNDYAEKITIAFKDKNENYDNKRLDRPDDQDKQRHKDNIDADSKKDAWDMITKNYNNWGEKSDFKKKDTYKHNDEYNKNDKYNDDYKKTDKFNDDFKKKDNYNDDYKKRDKYGDNYNYNDKYKNDYNKNDKYNDDYKNSGRYNDEYKKDEKYNKKKDTYSDNYKKNDRYNDDYKNNDKYNDDYKKNDKYNDDIGKSWNNKDTLNTDLKKTANRDDSEKLMDWNKPKETKTTNDNSWDTWKSKSMEKADILRHKKENTDSWDTPQKKETIGHASFEKPNKEWDSKDDIKDTPRGKTTEDWYRNEGNRKPYVPQNSDYYHAKPRLHDNIERIAFKAFGRTSIPFVGKKGIYEEK